MDDNSLMPFGKHKGERMQDVPAEYLLWLHDEGCNDPDVEDYIKENLDILNHEVGERNNRDSE